MKERTCPNCGEKHNFNIKKIGGEESWYVKCATCGHNGLGPEFESNATVSK